MNKEFSATTWEDQTSNNTSDATVPAVAQGQNGGPVKQIVTIRLDVDTLNWFKSAGPGYQTRINQILREYMDAQRVQKDKAA
jgi:uncharacterized protein (DUF4415 family)